MIERWRKLSPREKLQAQIVLGCLLVGLYSLYIYGVGARKYAESDMMLKRQLRQTQQRVRVENINSGPDPRAISRKIEEVEKAIQEVTASFDELDTGFAPADSSEVRQQLMLEISTLAERTGFELLSVARKGGSHGGDEDLSFHASVMKLQVYTRDLKTQAGGDPLPAAPGALFVSLVLSI
jgi:hypothetical protein